ncbi:transcriptional regulator, partial [Pseudomonas syringae pv. tagetis]
MTTVQNPVDYVTYRNEPFVKQVVIGLSLQQVLTIAGEPSSTIERKGNPGTCNN